jgi:hypothetical protein
LEREQSTPDITTAVLEALRDGDFLANSKVVDGFLNPVVDAIGKLENENSNLGDVWVQFTLIYKAFMAVDAPERFDHFKEHCLNILDNISSMYRKVSSSYG